MSPVVKPHHCLHRLGSSLAGKQPVAAALSGDPLLVALVDQDRSLPIMHRGAHSTAAIVDGCGASGVSASWWCLRDWLSRSAPGVITDSDNL